MKKLIISAATMMLAFSFSFAGTPETKGEAKPETSSSATFTYHVTSENGDGTVNFAPGAGPNCRGTEKLCEWTSSQPMTSPQEPSEILSNPNVEPESIRLQN